MVTFTVTKKRLLAVLFFLLAAVLAVCACVRGARAMQAAALKRSLPIYGVQTGEKKIAVSFDAAWGNEETQTLIDILGKYNVKSTFFVVGAWVDKYPDSVRALTAAGHEVCNHSDTHPHMPKLSQQDMTAQITSCNNKIKAITGTSPLLFRPPYGDYNTPLIDTVNGLKMYPIQWTVDSLDWKDPTPQQIEKNVISKVKPGSIILMHNGAKNTPQALPTILQTLQSQGYQFVKISDLIYRDNYTIDSQGTQISSREAASSSAMQPGNVASSLKPTK